MTHLTACDGSGGRIWPTGAVKKHVGWRERADWQRVQEEQDWEWAKHDAAGPVTPAEIGHEEGFLVKWEGRSR